MNLSTTNRLDKPKSNKLYLVIVAIILALGLGGYVVYTKMGGPGMPVAAVLKPSTYWAVFLNNGQTYFGRLDPDNLSGNFLNLSEVYYLDKAATAAPLTGQTTGNSATPGYTLVHLGSELHGPTDAMIINRQSVLFIEQLKPDSKVVAAIQSSKR